MEMSNDIFKDKDDKYLVTVTEVAHTSTRGLCGVYYNKTIENNSKQTMNFKDFQTH